MKLSERSIPYAPYVITTIKQIDEDDIVDGMLTLPKNANEIAKDLLMPRKNFKTIVIPNADYQINSNRLTKKVKPDFILTTGTELDSLFCNIRASKVILPDTLKFIKKPGFRGSQIDELEIPDSVEELDDEIFKNSVIKNLIINEKLLSQISVKYILNRSKKMVILVKGNSNQTQQYIIYKHEINSISSLFYVDEAIDMFLNDLFLSKANNDATNKLKKILKVKLLRTLKIKLLFGNLEEVSINTLVLHDRKFRKILKGIVDDHYLKTVLPQISSDGFTILKNDKKVKTLSLKEFLDNRN